MKHAINIAGNDINIAKVAVICDEISVKNGKKRYLCFLIRGRGLQEALSQAA